MKILLIVIDGLGDKPIKALGNKTPLEAAETPNLDFLAKNGICGQVLPFFKKGKLPTSEDTHLALFGYNPKISNPGRGVLEVMGIGMRILPGDVCLRGNFATVNENLKIIDRRAGRIEKTEPLIKAISRIKIEGVKFLVAKAVSHRIGIIMRGKGLSPEISDGDPKKTEARPLAIFPKKKSKKAIFTAKILNQFLEKAHFILKNHPLNKKRRLAANYILVRGAGVFKKIISFKNKYKLKTAVIAGGSLYKGIGKFLGMKEIKVKGANALPITNLRGKFIAARKALKKYDFIFCHIKAADNLAEDGNFLGKKKFIEKIDRNLKPILNPVRNQRFLNGVNLKDVLIVVTADHSTCCSLKRHCSEPVPVLIYGSKIITDKINKFSEKSCKRGKLGRIEQLNLMPQILLYSE